MKRHIFIVIVVASLSCGYLSAQDGTWGSVSGHVYTQDGKPLAHAKVELFPLETAISGPMPIATSNEDGEYRLLSPDLGKTRICAHLDGRGYPDTRSKVFASGNETFPEVLLAGGRNLTNVDIRLGPPDGVIELNVVDKDTEALIRFARITLRWADEPSVMYSSSIPQSGVFAHPLPTRHITISVTAPGYSTWSYVDPVSHENYIEVEPQDHRMLTVKMEKSSGSDIKIQ